MRDHFPNTFGLFKIRLLETSRIYSEHLKIMLNLIGEEKFPADQRMVMILESWTRSLLGSANLNENGPAFLYFPNLLSKMWFKNFQVIFFAGRSHIFAYKIIKYVRGQAGAKPPCCLLKYCQIQGDKIGHGWRLYSFFLVLGF